MTTAAGSSTWCPSGSTASASSSNGLRIVVDCADGSAYEIAPQVLRDLGADITVVNDAPTGDNINSRGGATKPHVVQQAAREQGAIGISFDGDADRAVFSDEDGNLINGDRTMAAWAAHWAETGGLTPPTVIGTVMSNGGFAAYLKERGVALHRASVGDKYVSRLMEETGARVGGEQRRARPDGRRTGHGSRIPSRSSAERPVSPRFQR